MSDRSDFLKTVLEKDIKDINVQIKDRYESFAVMNPNRQNRQIQSEQEKQCSCANELVM